MRQLESALQATIEGDLDQFSVVLGARHAQLVQAAEKLPLFSISSTALLRVLNQWRKGRLDASDIQKWASFIRHGFVIGLEDGPIHPIEISYETATEDVIAEIIGRITEIGDVIDGTIDDLEREQMLAVLQDVTS